MARSRRGGSRTPARPAPVSGPGTLSRRTDGGAGQPIRSFPAERQGQREQLAQQQAAAPLSRGGPPTPGAGGAGNATPPPQGIFGPSTQPNQPLTAGNPLGAGPGDPSVLPEDPDMLLRALYSIYPHPAILKLMNG